MTDSNRYQQKLEARRERLEARAERLASEARQTRTSADRRADMIPFGQPILVGHHSEGRDRRFREKIRNGYAKSYELSKAAEDAARRAASVGSAGISSDDPDAPDKLREKLAALEAQRARMVAANKLVRKGNRDGLLAMGFGETQIDSLFTPDFCGRLGFPDYALTNTGAEIRRCRQRIEELSARAEIEPAESMIGDVRIVEDPDQNRLQLFFPGKPDEERRTKLKRHGFRWAPSIGAWQRQLSNAARYAAQQALS